MPVYPDESVLAKIRANEEGDTWRAQVNSPEVPSVVLLVDGRYS